MRNRVVNIFVAICLATTLQVRAALRVEERRAPVEIDTITKGELSIGEVLVTGNRDGRCPVPYAMQRAEVGPDEVRQQNPQTAADMLGLSGSVFVQKSQQGGGSPMIRGFAANRLLYTVDGVRMNTAIFRSGNLQNVINIDPFAIAGTDIIKGAGPSVYGSDAIGGVMSFSTLKPQTSHDRENVAKGTAVARYSSANNEKTGHFDISLGRSKWASTTSFSHWDFDHLRQGSHGPDDYLKPYYVQRQNQSDMVVYQDDELLQIPSAYSQTNLLQKILYRPTDGLEVRYGLHYSTTSPYGRYDRHNRTSKNLPRYAEWSYGPQLWTMNHLSLVHKRATFMYDRLSMSAARQDFEESRISRSFNKSERTTQTEKVTAYSLNLDLEKRLCAVDQLFYGTELVFDDVTSLGEATDIDSGESAPAASRYPDGNSLSAAMYLANELQVGNKTKLQVGVRYNHCRLETDFANNLDFYPLPFAVSNTSHGAVTGNVGGTFVATKTLTLRACANTAFRSPNIDDVGKIFDAAPNTVSIPNTNLKPEYAFNVEAGFACRVNKNVHLDVTLYRTYLDRAIVRRDATFNGQDSIVYDGAMSKVEMLQNAAFSITHGIEAALDIKLGHGLGVSSTFNYQKGTEELDNGTESPSRQAVPMYGTTRFSYQNQRVKLLAYAVYQGERRAADMPEEEKGKGEIYAKDDQGNNYSPAWCTLNLKGEVAITPVITIATGIENIADVRYRPYSSGVSGAGRNFVMSMTARF